MISQTRFSITQTGLHRFGNTMLAEMDRAGVCSGNVGGQLGVDELVFDTSSGVLASLQEPPALTSLLSPDNGSCSFIV
jgi:hypothetical protein